jgi:hypothetical protein
MNCTQPIEFDDMIMNKKALYFTLEFANRFNTQSLLNYLKFNEMKFWIDDEGNTVFTSGLFTGPENKQGIISLDRKTVHIRLNKMLVEKMNAGDAEIALNSEIEQLLLVYKQIAIQLPEIIMGEEATKLNQRISESSVGIEALTHEFNIHLKESGNHGTEYTH